MSGTHSISRITLDAIIDHAIEQLSEWHHCHRHEADVEALDYIENTAFQVPDELSADDLARLTRVHQLPPTHLRDYITYRVQTELFWAYYHLDLHDIARKSRAAVSTLAA